MACDLFPSSIRIGLSIPKMLTKLYELNYENNIHERLEND